MNETERVFLNTAARENLFPGGSSICAAVSGGADSVAMVHLLSRFSRLKGWKVRVLHVNHRLRPEAHSDQLFVERLAEGLSLPFTTVFLETCPEGSMESRMSIARQAVYSSQKDLVAVAHTAEDRVETILLRLSEGAGLRGLGGMDYAGRGPVRRPVLDIRREALRDWLTAENIPWVEDRSNTDTSMARNRMRMNVLPVLEQNFPGAVQGMCRSGSILSGWRDLQDSITIMFPRDTMNRNEFLSLPGVLACLALWHMSGRPRKGFEEFGKIADWLQGGGTGEHLLPGGRRLVANMTELKVQERGSGRF